jgi:hypothetical protein
MNEAVAKLLDLLVYEILWPVMEEKVEKHRPVLLMDLMGRIFV